MPRTRKAHNAESQFTQKAIAELAHDIITYGHEDSGFWDRLSEALLIKVLPAGVDAALEKIRDMKISPEKYSGELQGLDEPSIRDSVLSQVECSLSAHIRRVQSVFPPHALKEIYRAWRERQAERQSRRICPTCRRPFW